MTCYASWRRRTRYSSGNSRDREWSIYRVYNDDMRLTWYHSVKSCHSMYIKDIPMFHRNEKVENTPKTILMNDDASVMAVIMTQTPALEGSNVKHEIRLYVTETYRRDMRSYDPTDVAPALPPRTPRRMSVTSIPADDIHHRKKRRSSVSHINVDDLMWLRLKVVVYITKCAHNCIYAAEAQSSKYLRAITPVRLHREVAFIYNVTFRSSTTTNWEPLNI